MSAARMEVDGDLVPWRRHSGTGRNAKKNGLNVEWQEKLAMSWVAQVGRGFGSARVSVRIVVYRGSRRRCDVDNLAKQVLDGLNGVAWDDDCQVDDLHVTRRLDRERPRVVVEVDLWDEGA